MGTDQKSPGSCRIEEPVLELTPTRPVQQDREVFRHLFCEEDNLLPARMGSCSHSNRRYFLRDRTTEKQENFDLYDHVKKSFQYTSYTDKTDTTHKVNERLEKHKEKEQDDLKKYNIAVAPMTGL